jgi:MoaA/NifB/PqqE/SkfB family radical SAM enzyme
MNIISVDPAPEKIFSIGWVLGSRCNYDCMYCPEELHDTTSKHHDLDKLKVTWNQIYSKSKHLGLPYKISFTGGEVTTNRNFFPFVEWIRNQDLTVYIFVISNGSAGLKYYKKLCQLVDGLTFSTHSEFMDERLFFQKCLIIDKLMIRPEKSFHVNIMDEYWNQDRIKKYIDLCQKHNISHSINEINYNKKTREMFFSKGKRNLDEI